MKNLMKLIVLFVFLDKIRDDKISLTDAKNGQAEFKSNLNKNIDQRTK